MPPCAPLSSSISGCCAAALRWPSRYPAASQGPDAGVWPSPLRLRNSPPCGSFFSSPIVPSATAACAWNTRCNWRPICCGARTRPRNCPAKKPVPCSLARVMCAFGPHPALRALRHLHGRKGPAALSARYLPPECGAAAVWLPRRRYPLGRNGGTRMMKIICQYDAYQYITR